MHKLKITLLGAFSAAVDGRPVGFGRAEARLIAYLALNAFRQLRRTRVAGCLWPDAPDRRARANLSTVLWRAQRQLGRCGFTTGVILTSARDLSLNPKVCEVDVDAFRSGCVLAKHSGSSLDGLATAVRAVEHYTGDLLDGWDEEWCVLERESLRLLHIDTLRQLSREYDRRGRHDIALGFARRACEADPLSETAQREFIGLLLKSGRKSDAHRQYRRFASLSRAELGVDPDKETSALLESGEADRADCQVPAGMPAGWEPVKPELVPLVGRQSERRELEVFLEDVRRGKGGVVVVVGETGIGKSKIIRWLWEEWASRGGRLAYGACVEFNEPVPYQSITDAIDGFVDVEAILSAEVKDAPARRIEREGLAQQRKFDDTMVFPAGRLRLYRWLRAQLQTVAVSAPLLIVVEDLQWADDGSLDFVAYLRSHLEGLPIGLILSWRTGSDGRQRRRILQQLELQAKRVLRLGRLTKAETKALLRYLVGNTDGLESFASWLWLETEGNPLFIVETVRLVRQSQVSDMLRSPRSRQLPHGISDVLIPDGVKSAILQRLSTMKSTAQHLVTVASILGRTFAEDLLADVAGLRPNAFSQAVAELIGVGILEREGATLRFSHDKIRAVCYAGLPSTARRVFHGRAAAILSADPAAAASAIGWHHTQAGHWRLATEAWISAGDSAQEIYAYQDAIRAYEQAVLCIGKDSTRSRSERDFEECVVLGRIEESWAALCNVAERSRALERMGRIVRRSRHLRCEALWLLRKAQFEEFLGNFVQASWHARRGWFVARRADDNLLQGENLRVCAWCLSQTGRPRRSIAVSRVALRILGDSPTVLKAQVRWQMAFTYIVLGEYGAARECVSAARHILSTLGHSGDTAGVLLAESVIDRITGRLSLAQSKLRKAEVLARESGNTLMLARSAIHLTITDTLRGDLGAALRRLRRSRVESRMSGSDRVFVSCLNEVAYGVGRLVGNYEWCRKSLERAFRLPVVDDSAYALTMLRSTEALLELDQCRFSRALQLVEELLRPISVETEWRGVSSHYYECLLIRGVSELRAARYGEAIADLERARRGFERTSDRVLLVDALSYLALAQAHRGDLTSAVALSEESIALLEAVDYANYQPQRVFWNHYRILFLVDCPSRLSYLQRAAGFVEAQASTLSASQARRLKRDVELNREILKAWEAEAARASAPSERRLRPPVAAEHTGTVLAP